jgi:aminoglycoside phosphotransferase (APT) family kinase protein
VHGDLNPSNIPIVPGGQFALLDWDEARVDASLFDVLAVDPSPHTRATRRALDAWEVAVCWWVEPDYARKVARKLGFA